MTADARAPIDVVGTGSFIRDSWHETYATADIIENDGRPMAKLGREFLLRNNGARRRATDQTRVRRRRASWGRPHVGYHPKQRQPDRFGSEPHSTGSDFPLKYPSADARAPSALPLPVA